jgi:RHS repeat-associated protein
MPGATRTLTYDPLQRPTQIKSVSIAGAVIMDYRYTYDAAGNITQRETEDGDYLYSYDTLDRLTGATPPVSLQQSPANPNGLPVEQYTYDPVHNRKTSAHQPGSWSYNANNELTAYGTGADEQTYIYDANGNTIEQKSGDPLSPSKTRTFLYNAGERLSEVQDNGISIGKYQYDPMGRRIRKEAAGRTTWFQYADEGLLAEFSESGQLAQAYGWMPNELWGTGPVWLTNINKGWSPYFYQNDNLGTPQRLTSADGTKVWQVFSEAFGRSNVSFSDMENNIRFPGQYYDVEIDVVYNYYRYYNYDSGRYIESDPIGIRGGINFFSYTSNKPTSMVDRLGLAACSRDCCKEVQWPTREKDFAAGTVQCCDGKAVTCINPKICIGKDLQGQRLDFSPKACRLIKKCAKVHEDFHKDHHVNCSGKPEDGAPFEPDFAGGRGECEGYREEIPCLDISKCEGEKFCETIVRMTLEHKKMKKDANCAAAGM